MVLVVLVPAALRIKCTDEIFDLVECLNYLLSQCERFSVHVQAFVQD